jgi:hypothetical protein
MDTSYHRIKDTPISRWIDIRTSRSRTHSSLDHGHTHIQMNAYTHLVINGYIRLRIPSILIHSERIHLSLDSGYTHLQMKGYTHLRVNGDALNTGEAATAPTVGYSVSASSFFYFPMYFIHERFCTVWQDFILLPHHHSPPTRPSIAIVATSRPEILVGLLKKTRQKS